MLRPGHMGLSTIFLRSDWSGKLDGAAGLHVTTGGLQLAQVSGLSPGQPSVTAVPSSASTLFFFLLFFTRVMVPVSTVLHQEKVQILGYLGRLVGVGSFFVLGIAVLG